jgi:3-phenylpropionate/cinnamic acid dioxygenase small subunit
MGPLSRIYVALQNIEDQQPEERRRRLQLIWAESQALLKARLDQLSTSPAKPQQK